MAATGFRVLGLETTLASMNKEVRRIKRRTRRGLIKAGFLIQREAQLLCPVEYGNLKASAFTVWGGKAEVTKPATAGGFKGPQATRTKTDHEIITRSESAKLRVTKEPQVEVGFTAFYAIYVHENMEAKHPVGEAKFLEKAIARNQAQIVKVIADDARRGL